MSGKSVGRVLEFLKESGLSENTLCTQYRPLRNEKRNRLFEKLEAELFPR